MEQVISYYENYSEDTRLIRDNAHKVEFITTTYVLDKLIKPNSRILDVGAGTGRYSIYFAEQGHSVYSLEFVPHNVSIIQDKVKDLECRKNMEMAVGDGRDLSRFEDESFDVVLCMGPFYHLSNEEDKRHCVSECLRVLKKDGILAIAYLNKFANFMYHFSDDKNFIKEEESRNIIELGHLFEDGRFNFFFTTPQEVEAMLSDFNAEKLSNVGTDGISYLFKDILEGFNEEEYKLWLNYHLRTCAEPSILGYSLHALLISRKL